MPFTAQEIENVANAAIEFHLDKGRVFSQTLQNKPLLKEMLARERPFPGGKDNLTIRVKGAYTSSGQGFEHDDAVTYQNPANIKTATYPWKLHHEGIEVTLHELLKDGISIVDTATGKGEARHSERELTALANLFEDKLEDLEEGFSRFLNLTLWKDGTQDPKVFPGIRSIILDDPTSATVVGGIDQSANAWWRNRAQIGIDVSTPSDLNLVTALQQQFRQLRRYGTPRHLFLAGSDFLDAFEKELRSKGNFTLEGWAKSGRIDASVADVSFKGVNVEYDPTLDDLGLAKYGFVIDTKSIVLRPIEGESMKRHNPARPAEKYVLYRAVTWVGGLTCRQRNTSGVYSIA